MTGKQGGYLSIEDAEGSLKTTYLEDGFLDFLDKVYNLYLISSRHNSLKRIMLIVLN